MNKLKSRIWAKSNPREHYSQPLHSPHVTVWYGFIGSFILGLFFFEEPRPVSGRKTCTVTTERYPMLLRDHVVHALQERHALSVVFFMQDGARPTLRATSRRSCWNLSPKTGDK